MLYKPTELPPTMSNEIFQTFWHGPQLTWIARLCLSSFIARGHRVELFSYASVGGVPPGVVVRHAGEILPSERVFLYEGGSAELSAPSLHSNLFRYKLLRDHGGWWIDTDVLLLDGEIPRHVPVFGLEDWVEGSCLLPSTGDDARVLGLGTAVMKFSPGTEIMDRAYTETAAMIENKPGWATTGPFLFTRLAVELGLAQGALPQSKINAITWNEAYKFVRTEYRQEVERRTAGAPFVHLYNHGMKLAGVAEALPPEGSFLGCRLNVPISAGADE